MKSELGCTLVFVIKMKSALSLVFPINSALCFCFCTYIGGFHMYLSELALSNHTANVYRVLRGFCRIPCCGETL